MRVRIPYNPICWIGCFHVRACARARWGATNLTRIWHIIICMSNGKCDTASISAGCTAYWRVVCITNTRAGWVSWVTITFWQHSFRSVNTSVGELITFAIQWLGRAANSCSTHLFVKLARKSVQWRRVSESAWYRVSDCLGCVVGINWIHIRLGLYKFHWLVLRILLSIN